MGLWYVVLLCTDRHTICFALAGKIGTGYVVGEVKKINFLHAFHLYCMTHLSVRV